MDAVVTRRPRLALPRRALRSASDERLVEQLRAGSVNAFEEIYDRHHRGILGFCRHMLGSQQEAEDAVQHTFIASHRSLLADDREIALKAWLYVVARNRCLSLLRARHEHADIDDAATVVPATGGLSAEVEGREDLRALLGDLQRLPEDQRAALVLAELEAHSHDEIAVILGVPTAKVKALVFQARAALMSRRQGRDAGCGPIREQLSVVRGGALRRGELRHHVEQCAGCRAFASEVRSQRAAMAVLLPVIPSLALKHSTLTAVAAAAGTGAAGGTTAVVGGAGAGGAAAAGGTAAGGAAAGGAAAGGAAAGGAAAGGAAAGGGSAVLTSGSALLGVKVIAAKAAIALALSAAAGGGYVAVEHSRDDHARATPGEPASARPDQTRKPAVDALVPPSDVRCPSDPGLLPDACAKRAPGKADHAGAPNREDNCPKQPANACPAPTPAPGASGTRTPRDLDGDGKLNRLDACPIQAASTANGCPPDTPGTTPTPRTPGDRDGDGTPNRQDACPTQAADTTTGCPPDTPGDVPP
jgi:RNA polymerase sigma factor (sigma-70 family)